MEISDYLINVIPVNLMELIAALAGTYYLKKNAKNNKSEKYLILFLWFTLFVEIIGAYAPVAYFSNYQYFSFVENTVFEDNRWIYNIYSVASVLFFMLYFRCHLKNKLRKKILKILSFLFLISSIAYLLFTNAFFYEDSKFTVVTGTLLLLVSVIFFYLELLKSDTILKIKHFLPFYISVGTLIFYLCITPISIFSEFFKAGNDLFINLQVSLLLYANIFMYSVYIIGFIVCQTKKKSY
ncbi:hypothetical protein ABXT64_01090 [Candidatus Marifrigoribacter sp. Uisw_064]|uniref:hypothetical protein n=1 Tax=Candidatus Marifrigoribacter sp. Uisw_064 TaxID=3230970 RepID=UPI003D50F3DE